MHVSAHARCMTMQGLILCVTLRGSVCFCDQQRFNQAHPLWPELEECPEFLRRAGPSGTDSGT